MTTSLAPTLPSDATACVSVPATSATLLATFAAVLLAPSDTACARANVCSDLRIGCPRRTAPDRILLQPVIVSHARAEGRRHANAFRQEALTDGRSTERLGRCWMRC